METLQTLERDDGWHVRFVTSPFTSPFCMPEKLQWVRQHFGDKTWQDRVIFTKDKTVIRGDNGVLIDDNPDMDRLPGKSALVLQWEHVVFSRSYNQHCTDKLRLESWRLDHVRKVLAQVKKRVWDGCVRE